MRVDLCRAPASRRRWPGDAHTFSLNWGAVLSAPRRARVKWLAGIAIEGKRRGSIPPALSALEKPAGTWWRCFGILGKCSPSLRAGISACAAQSARTRNPRPLPGRGRRRCGAADGRPAASASVALAGSEQQRGHLAAVAGDEVGVIDDEEGIDEILARQAVGMGTIDAQHLEEMFQRRLVIAARQQASTK